MKKYFVLLALFLTARASPVFSVSVINAIANHKFTLMDIPLANGMDYFFSALPFFAGVSLSIATLLGFTTIVWNAFRLWAGTQDVKKAVVDIMCKIILFTALLNIYPLIVDFVMVKASNWGARAGTGMATVYVKFAEYRDTMQTVYDRGRQQLDLIASGEVTVSPDVAQALATSFYADEEQVEQFMASLPVTGSSASASSFNMMAAMGTNTNVAASMYAKSDPDSLRASADLKRGIADFYKKMEQTRGANFASAGEISNAIAVMNAMDEIFSENPAFTAAADGSESGTGNIAKYLLSPYMTDAHGNPTGILSPSAIVKMGVVIGSIISSRMNAYYDENREIMQDKTLFIEHPTFLGLLHIILSFLMVVGLIAAVCFYVIQYVMCIFEYAVTTSVGALFIAFCLFDGTKSFTAKLVTLFSSYFIKILVMNFCLFWVLGTFVDVGSTIIMADDPGSLLNFAYFFFTLLLCWVVTQNGPAIAVALLNGSPQLSMGEFLHAAGTAAAGAVMARRAVGSAVAITAGAASTVGRAAQAGVRGTQTGFAMFSGAAHAADAAGLAGGSRNKAVAGAFGAMLLSSAKQKMGETATGNKGKLDDDTKQQAIARVGGGYNQDNKNANGTQTFTDAQGAMERYTRTRLNRQKTQAEKNAPPPPVEPPGNPSEGEAKRRLNDQTGVPPNPDGPKVGGDPPGRPPAGK
jgi:type IV secretion system protein TrbL